MVETHVGETDHITRKQGASQRHGSAFIMIKGLKLIHSPTKSVLFSSEAITASDHLLALIP